MTKLQVVQFIQRRLKAKESVSFSDTTGHWPVAEIIDRANEAETEICHSTGCLSGVSTVTSVASQREYSMDDDWDEIVAVMWDDVPLEPVTWEELTWAEGDVGAEAKWRTLTSADPIAWGMSESSGSFFVYKTPTAAETDVMSVFHTILPTAWATTDTTTTLPLNAHTNLTPYHQLICWRVLSGCFEEDVSGGEGDGNLIKASVYRKRYETGLARLRATIKFPKWAMPQWRMSNTRSTFRGVSWGSGRPTG